jgi:methionyl-tRNA formyltransferase
MCSDEQHPVNEYLQRWIDSRGAQHEVSLARRQQELGSGDLLFLISCSELVSRSTLEKFRHAVLIHASDLPKGRGWSPHIWELCAGAEEITVSLLAVEDEVDTGAIWKKLRVPISKSALWDEVNQLLFEAELKLMDFAVDNFDSVDIKPQDATRESSYYRRRTADDSRLDPHFSIASQFDLLRVCDPNRYPAFFELHGCRYKLVVEKLDEQ